MRLKNFIITTSVIVLTASALNAQSSLDYQFTKTITNNLPYDADAFSVFDNNGNIITSGCYTGTTDFDPNAGVQSITAAGSRDGFVQKLDANGNYIWAKEIVSTSIYYTSDIETDNFGNIYIAGYFQGTLDCDPGAGVANLTSGGINNSVLIKLDQNGDYLWSKHFSCTGNSYRPSISINTLTNNVVFCGSFTNTLDIDLGATTQTLTSAGGFDGFLVELDNSGNYIQHFQIGITGSDAITEVAFDENNNLVIVGGFAGTVDFDLSPGVSALTSLGQTDIFIAKYSPLGALIWVKQQSCIDYARATNVCISNTGSILVSGSFNSGTIDLDPGPSNADYNNSNALGAFITKLTANGDFVNFVGLDGGAVRISEMRVNEEDRIIVSGAHQNTVDFDPSASTDNNTSTSYDEFYWILDDLLNYQEVNIRTGIATSNGYGSYSMDVKGSLILSAGSFFNTVDMDFTSGTDNFSSIGSIDNYVSVFTLCGISSKDTTEVSSCASYTWPINGMTYTSSGYYSESFSNVLGCDSLIYIDLTIDSNSPNAVTQNGGTFMADFSGASYQWIDCANSNSPIAGETSQSFTPLMNGDYAVIIDNGSCSDTSACITIGDVGLDSDEFQKFKVYPNPVTSELNISSEIGLQQISILDVNGRLIIGQNVNSLNSFLIDVSTFESGVYFLETIDVDGFSITSKFVKE